MTPIEEIKKQLREMSSPETSYISMEPEEHEQYATALAAIEELEADLEHTRRALEKEVAVSDLATNEAKEWQSRALKAERKLEFVERQQLGPSIEREKRLEQQNAKLMEALEEMYSAMLRYQSDAETEAPPAHRTMMYKAAQVLAEGGGK